MPLLINHNPLSSTSRLLSLINHNPSAPLSLVKGRCHHTAWAVPTTRAATHHWAEIRMGPEACYDRAVHQLHKIWLQSEEASRGRV